MAKWTDPKNLRKNDRIEVQGGTVTVKGTPTEINITRGGSKTTASHVEGTRDDSKQSYSSVVPNGQKVKKII